MARKTKKAGPRRSAGSARSKKGTQTRARKRAAKKTPALRRRRSTRVQATRSHQPTEEEPKEVMLSFRFDRDTANWLRAAAFWTGIPGAELVRTSLRKELAALERKFGKRFPRPPERE